MTKEEFNKIDKLYQYTNFCSALQIIISNTLLFNPLKRMNDINELYRPSLIECGYGTKENFKVAQKMIYDHQQISLTRDFRGKKGFDIPAMWGHYADKGRGVCLIFDKNKLINTLSKKHRRKIVKYVEGLDPDIQLSAETIKRERFSNSEYDIFFFRKSKDWSYEQEFRVLIQSDSDQREKLELKDALVGAIMCRADDVQEGHLVSESRYYKMSQKVCPNIYTYEACGAKRMLFDSDRNTIFPNIDPKRFVPCW